MFVYQNLFFQYLLFYQSQSCLLESAAAIFRQSAGYVFYFVIRKIFSLYPLKSKSEIETGCTVLELCLDARYLNFVLPFLDAR